MTRILALQHVRDDPPGYLEEILQEYGIACHTVHVEHEPLPDPTAYAAIVLMGGSQHLYDEAELPYLTQEKAALLNAIEHEIPTLGICLGGQLLASALGAEVRKHHLPELGFYRIPLTEAGSADPLFVGLPGHHLAFHWHEDVFELPDNAIRLASNANASNQAFRYGKNIYALQFHIELNAEMVHTWLNHPDSAREISEFLGDPDAPRRLNEEWTMHKATYQQHTRALFENFLRIASLV